MYSVEKRGGKKGQVTLFIILGIIILSSSILFFAFKDKLLVTNVPKDFRGVYEQYLACVESTVKEGIMLLGDNAGYIEKPNLILGFINSEYNSQFEIFGNHIPYWLYLSNNGSFVEQVPSKRDMELELEQYVSSHLNSCDFSNALNEGYNVIINSGKAFVTINDNNVNVEIINKVDMYFDDKYYSLDEHKINVPSKLGKYYKLAKSIYDYEKQEMFLEKYTMDVLWNYAPVEDVSFDCSSVNYKEDEIKDNLLEALEQNINFIKFKGSYYDSSLDRHNGYFVKNTGMNFDENTRVLFDRNWSNVIDIYGEKNVNPIDAISGILGVCLSYTHLVYDIRYPVLIQIWDEDFVFQFPIRVVIDNNEPRELILPDINSSVNYNSKVCENMNSRVSIKTYDSDLNPIPARISYSCVSSNCELGESVYRNGLYVYSGLIPTCVNGVVKVSAEGFGDTEFVYTSGGNNDVLDLILYKEYELNVEILDLREGDSAMLSFYGENNNNIETIMYPETKVAKLSEDNYIVSAYIYSGTEITIPSKKEQYCTKQSTGFSEIFGIEFDNCKEITIPEIKMERVLIGGGEIEQYFTSEMLRNINSVRIRPTMFGVPTSSEELQGNYLNIENSKLNMEFI